MLGLSKALHLKRSARRGKETQQLDLCYRDSPLSEDRRSSKAQLRAGDRAPDAPCVNEHGEPCRIFDALRHPGWTLLAFGAPPITARHSNLNILAITRRATGGAWHDTRGHAHAAYSVNTKALALIRPDGYIAMTTDDLSFDAIERYLSQIATPHRHAA